MRSTIEPTACTRNCKEDSNDHQRGDHILQRQETKRYGDAAQREQRNVREMQPRMNPREHAKIIAVERGRIGNAGIAEHQTKRRKQRPPT